METNNKKVDCGKQRAFTLLFHHSKSSHLNIFFKLKIANCLHFVVEQSEPMVTNLESYINILKLLLL